VLAAFPIELSGGRVRPRLGYAALNLDAGNEYDGREVLVRNESRGGLGFDYQTPAVVVFGQQVAAAQFSFDYDFIDRAGRSSDDDAFGLELSAIDMMHFRFGVIDESSRILGIGLGWDYGHMLFRLDYAHANNQQLSSYYDRDTFGALVGVRW